jgi:uncharacterized membrane protein
LKNEGLEHKAKNGVLVFIIFEEKYYDIIADEGISRRFGWNMNTN